MKTEIGYYKVNDKIYSSKLSAIMAAKDTKSAVEWNFFDDVFSKVNWKVEPSLSLDELYCMRAKQIRDQYDYVIVFCSGGADSNNVIRTFLNNNIHVDEVIGLAPMSGLKNWNFDPNDVNETNTITETKFALLPLLNEIATANPRIKITVNDFFEDMINYKDDDWVYKDCGTIVTVLTSHFTDVIKFPHIDKMVQQGKRVALVYGTDKPVVKITEKGNLYIVFSDYGVNYLNMPEDRENPLIDRVLFYWTPDLPELMVKQCHVIAKALTLPELRNTRESLKSGSLDSIRSFADFLTDLEEKDQAIITKDDIITKFLNDTATKSTNEAAVKTQYQRSLTPFIYPSTYTKDLFQCYKVDAWEGFFTKDQQWLHNLHKGSRISEMVKSGIKLLYNSIPSQYLNIKGTGFFVNLKYYKFGNINDFDSRYANKD